MDLPPLGDSRVEAIARRLYQVSNQEAGDRLNFEDPTLAATAVELEQRAEHDAGELGVEGLFAVLSQRMAAGRTYAEQTEPGEPGGASIDVRIEKLRAVHGQGAKATPYTRRKPQH